MGRVGPRHPMECAICGEHYIQTNWMLRPQYVILTTGKLYRADTHLLGCAKRHPEKVERIDPLRQRDFGR